MKARLLLIGIPVTLSIIVFFSQQQQLHQTWQWQKQSHAATNVISGSGIPQFSHIFLIMMENHDLSQIIGNSAAPYINQLANQYALATQYSAITHPSLPNYIALTSGGTQGITTDCTTCFITVNNIGNQIESGGKTWKAYMEDMTGNCQLSSSATYVQKHNPFAYYTNLRSSCQNNDVPYTQFASDLKSGNLANFIWITPNMIHDMHDGTIQQGDTWLQTEVPKILASSAYQQNGLLIITWDEGTRTGNNHVATLIISPLAKHGFQSSVSYDHYSLLRTISEGLSLQPLGSAANAISMSDFFTITKTNPTPSIPPTGSPFPAGNTSISLTLCPHGIASCGDNPNPQSVGNMNPQHTGRSVSLTIADINNNPITTGQGTVTFNPDTGTFKGTVDLGNIQTGQYIMKVTMPQYLTKQIGVVQQITAGQTNTSPEVFLVAGDIDGDNKLDIIDYNQIVNCFGTKQCSNKQQADITDDGKVDGIDYNLFLRELSVQNGQ